MSFFSDLFQGNFSNLGNDLAPSNIFSDTASSFANQPGWAQGLEIGGTAALGAFALPELLPALGGLDLSGAGAAGFGAASDAFGTAADIGSTLGPGVDASLLDTTGAVLPAESTLTAGNVGTDFLMGGGGTQTADQAFATGPSFAQDLTSGELLAGTGIGGGSPVGAFGAAPGAAGGGSIGDVLGTIGSGFKTAAPVIGAAGLGLNLYSGMQEKKALGTLAQTEAQAAQQAQNTQAAANKAAQPLLTSGEALTQYLATNTLPPQFQSQVDQWVKSQKAAITQGYASRGQSGDPKQNSALQQDLANIDQQALGLQAQFEEILSSAGQQMVQTANQLLSTGLNATQLGAEIPIQIAKLNAQLNAQMGTAIANFASAVNGSNRQGAPGSLNISLNPQTGAING